MASDDAIEHRSSDPNESSDVSSRNVVRQRGVFLDGSTHARYTSNSSSRMRFSVYEADGTIAAAHDAYARTR